MTCKMKNRNKNNKKPDHSSFWVYVPIWNANLYVYVGGDFSKFQAWACKNTSFPSDRVYEMSRHVNSNATTYGWYGDAIIYSMTPIRKSVLVHELLHFVLQLLRHRDVDECDDEVRCYLLEWLYKEVVEKMPKEMIKRGTQMMITKDDLIYTNEAYWNIVNRARELLYEEHPAMKSIDVDEIHVDPEEDYVFVSWSWQNKEDCGHLSTSYRINKFLSMINKEEKVDPNDRIPVKLNGVRK